MKTNQSRNSAAYQPLKNLLDALEADDLESREELDASLTARGFDPARISVTVRATVEAGLRQQRLSWQDVARTNVARLKAARTSAMSWARKSAREIDEAFGLVIQGAFGAEAQSRVQAAFRNLDNLSTADKASFLDDIAALEQMDQNPQSDQTP